MSLCLTASGVTVALALTRFALTWTHSVEKTEWRESWRVETNRLLLDMAQVKGSGAGIDPPPEARLTEGFWRWHPYTRHRRVVLNDAGSGMPWRLCSDEMCIPASEIVPSRGTTLVLESCNAKGVPLHAFQPGPTKEPFYDE